MEIRRLSRSIATAALCLGLACGPLATLEGSRQSTQAAGVTVQRDLLRQAAAHPGSTMRVIVQAQGPVSTVRAALVRLGAHVTADLSIIHALAASIPAHALPRIARVQGVRWVSPDAGVVHSAYSCCTPGALQEVYTQAVGAAGLWAHYQGQGIGVAVVDSGVNPQQDLYTPAGANRLVAAVNFSAGYNTSADDGYGHGNHVAGIIAGNGSSSTGAYIGVAPSANIVDVKVSDDNGQASISSVVNGLQWVFSHKSQYNIRVVNLSLNSTVADSYQVDPLDAAVETLWNAGIVVVVSAGNSGSTHAGVLFAPANDPFAITVGAVDDHGTVSTGDDTLDSFSSYGTLPVSTTAGLTTNIRKPDLVAPGTNLVSLMANQNSALATAHPDHVLNHYYFRMSGTSMAAAVVSGAAALLLQANPALTPNQVKYRLMSTARPVATTTGVGAGEVNATNAVANSSTTGANQNIALAASLQASNPAALWGSASWGSASWGSTSWGSASWGSASWGSASWGSASWGSASWGSDYWG